jgi:hypothetical protein
LAANQALDGPVSIASDRAAGFYVSSSSQNRVYRVAADGKISLIAGIGTPDFSGNGGTATSARLSHPAGLAVGDTIILALGRRQQIVKYLWQDFARPDFKGSLVFRCQAGASFVAVALLDSQGASDGNPTHFRKDYGNGRFAAADLFVDIRVGKLGLE